MRKLSSKTINSLALCVALAAPLVYMFGTLFMYLAGAHGNMELAQTKTEELVLNWNNFHKGQKLNETTGQVDYDARFASTDLYGIEANTQYLYTVNNLVTGANSQFRIYYYDQEENFLSWTMSVPVRDQITATSPATAAYVKWSIYSLEENSTANLDFDSIVIDGEVTLLTNKSDYLFSQFFAQNNWLAESGRKVLEATPLYGFEPIGELVRYTDANMLHLANISYGPLVIGYTYYCAHVIIVDLIFYIGSFIPRLIKKTINKLEGGLD